MTQFRWRILSPHSQDQTHNRQRAWITELITELFVFTSVGVKTGACLFCYPDLPVWFLHSAIMMPVSLWQLNWWYFSSAQTQNCHSGSWLTALSTFIHNLCIHCVGLRDSVRVRLSWRNAAYVLSIIVREAVMLYFVKWV